MIVLGIVLESGASVRLAAPNPVANSCSLDSPPDVGDVSVQAPGLGPGRPQLEQHGKLTQGVWVHVIIT